jgi:hypothetical protein
MQCAHHCMSPRAAVSGAACVVCAGNRWAASVLTHDHHPGKPEEMQRCEAAGASIHRSGGGKYRLMGELEVSRSFGDVSYRDKGVIADPDFLVVNLTVGLDQLLVLASDGVFEEMAPEDVCLHAWAEAVGDTRVTMTHPRPPAILLPGVVTEPAAADSAPTAATAAGSDTAGPDAEEDNGHGVDSSTRIRHEQLLTAPKQLQHWRKCSTPSASQQPSRTTKAHGADAAWSETYCCDCSSHTYPSRTSSSSSGTRQGASQTPTTSATTSSISSDSYNGWPAVPGPLTCVEPPLPTHGVAPHQLLQPHNMPGTAGRRVGRSSSTTDAGSTASCGYSAWQPAPLPLAQAVTARLLQEAYNRGSMDNLALVVLDLQPSAAGGGLPGGGIGTAAVVQQGAKAMPGGHALQYDVFLTMCHCRVHGLGS